MITKIFSLLFILIVIYALVITLENVKKSGGDELSSSDLGRQITTRTIFNNFNIPQIKTIFDVGAGDAVITDEFMRLSNAKHAYVTDFTPPRKTLPNITYIPLDKFLSYPNKSVDMVTASMSIHHFTNAKIMLAKMNALLPIGGYLLIKEHDTYPMDDKLHRLEHKNYLELLHLVYAIIQNEKIPDEMTFRTKDELQKLLESEFGFKLLDTTATKPRDLQMKYGAIYVKTTNIEAPDSGVVPYNMAPISPGFRFKEIGNNYLKKILNVIYYLLSNRRDRIEIINYIKNSNENDIDIIKTIKSRFKNN